MERLAQIFREYPVETVEELEDILEAELSYMGE